jgi:hypothetical protein
VIDEFIFSGIVVVYVLYDMVYLVEIQLVSGDLVVLVLAIKIYI